uniref:Uncharacterized protein n=1 Tax=Quercus lobata TaxID=97700 RepID=A0A7N2LFP5_QUELO
MEKVYARMEWSFLFRFGQSPYRGGGGRGGRPSRVGGRGHFRGRGHGQGGGRHYPPHGAAITTATASAPVEGGAAIMPPPSASVSGQAQLPVAAQVPGAPFWPPPRMAWCELCRVDCNTLEIQEPHKNFAKQQKEVVGNSEVLAFEPEGKPQDHFAARGRGLKRKMRGGQWGKYIEPMKDQEGRHLTGKKHQGNQKRFHGHRDGEAGLQALYPPNFNAPSKHGQMGLQAVYQPNVNSPSTSLTPQVQPGVNDPQILLAQLLMSYVLSQAQAPGLIPAAGTLASVPVPPAAASQSILETENQQGSESRIKRCI